MAGVNSEGISHNDCVDILPRTENAESSDSDTVPLLQDETENLSSDSESTLPLKNSDVEYNCNNDSDMEEDDVFLPKTSKKRKKGDSHEMFLSKEGNSSSASESASTSLQTSNNEMRNTLEEEEDQMCPICLDLWTSEGGHRLCSLKCGHLFGKSCIYNWLVKEKKYCCPQCNKKARSYDIRELFATRLVALDCSEKTRLEKETETVREEKRKVEMELEKYRLCLESYKHEVNKLQKELAKFTGKANSDFSNRVCKFHLEKTIQIVDGGCRVCAYDSYNKILLLCHQTKNLLFSGFGVKKIQKIGLDYSSNNYLHLHGKPIRDIRIHPCNPKVILTVGFDKTAKICDLEKQTVLQTISLDYLLWSCCWDEEDSNFFYVGTGKGIIHVFDIRSPSFSVTELKLEGDTSPVVSICYVPNKFLNNVRGGIICCRLNSVVFYQKLESNQYNQYRFSNLVGPFFFLFFDPITGHFVVSCRPSASVPNVRHLLCELDGSENCRPVHVFMGGTVQSNLSRTCFVRFEGETLAAVFQENVNAIELWSTASGQKVSCFHVREAILDLISLNIGERTFIVTVSDSVVRFYEAS